MTIDSYKEDFYNNGFIVIRDCVPSEVLNESRVIMGETLSKLLNKKVDYNEGLLEAVQKYKQFEVQALLHGQLQAKGLKKCILLQPQILNTLIHLIGPDLAYNREGSIHANLRSTTESIYKKKWHQEVWSGGSILHVTIWIPLSLAEPSGGIGFIPGSHIWG